MIPRSFANITFGITCSLAALIVLLAGPGCMRADTLRDPMVHSYRPPSLQTELWAVAPLSNESGASVAEPLRLADALVREAQQIDGVDTVPVNRVIAVMESLGIERVTHPAEADAIRAELGVDALLVGTVTAWDPYRPMVLGLAVAMYRADDARFGMLDPRDVQAQSTETVRPSSLGPLPPAAVAAAVFEASNHRTLKWLRAYADGRNEPDNAFGPDVYLASMDRFMQFACFRILGELLGQLPEAKPVDPPPRRAMGPTRTIDVSARGMRRHRPSHQSRAQRHLSA